MKQQMKEGISLRSLAIGAFLVYFVKILVINSYNIIESIGIILKINPVFWFWSNNIIALSLTFVFFNFFLKIIKKKITNGRYYKILLNLAIWILVLFVLVPVYKLLEGLFFTYNFSDSYITFHEKVWESVSISIKELLATSRTLLILTLFYRVAIK